MMLHGRPAKNGVVVIFGGVVALGLLVAPQAASKEEFKDWREASPEEWGLAEDPARGIQHAVILTDHHIIDDGRTDPDLWLRGDKVPCTFYSRYVRVRVLDQVGVERWRTVEVPYDKEAKVTRIAARTLKHDGTTVPLDEKEIRDKTLAKFSRRRVKARVLAFKGVEPGDIVELQYTIKYETIDPPAIQLRRREHVIDSEVRWLFFRQVRQFPELATRAETEELRKKITYLPGYVIPNGKRFQGVITEFPASGAAKEGFTVEFKNLPELPDESYISSEQETAVTFVPYYAYPLLDAETPFWDRVSVELGKISRKFLEDQDRLAGWLDPLKQNTRDLDGDVQACVALVRDKIVNLDLEAENERKDVPEIENLNDMIEEGVGRTWQINLLVLAMLRGLGYQATIFEARDADQGPFLPQWHSWRQFTSEGVAIKTAEGTLRLIMPGHASADPQSIPWQICGTTILLEDTTPKGRQNPFGTLVDLPAAPSAGNEHSLEGTVKLGGDGALTGVLRSRIGCASQPYWSQDLKDRDGRLSADALDKVRPRVIDADLGAVFLEDSVQVQPSLVAYACSLQVQGLVEEAGGSMLVQLGRIRADDFDLPDRVRESVLDFHHPRNYFSDVALALEPGVEVVSLPEPVRILLRGAVYEQDCLQDGEAVHVRRRLSIEHSRYRPETAQDFRRFFEELKAASEQPIVLRRGEGE